MKEHYVSYEQAVKLKELGFDERTTYEYTEIVKDSGREEWDEDEQRMMFIEDINYYPKLRLDQAQAWLREVKEIDVLVFNCSCGYGWEISKANPESRGTGIAIFDDEGEDENSGMWLSYESALSAGIDKALELLGKEVNNA